MNKRGKEKKEDSWGEIATLRGLQAKVSWGIEVGVMNR